MLPTPASALVCPGQAPQRVAPRPLTGRWGGDACPCRPHGLWLNESRSPEVLLADEPPTSHWSGERGDQGLGQGPKLLLPGLSPRLRAPEKASPELSLQRLEPQKGPGRVSRGSALLLLFAGGCLRLYGCPDGARLTAELAGVWFSAVAGNTGARGGPAPAGPGEAGLPEGLGACPRGRAWAGHCVTATSQPQTEVCSSVGACPPALRSPRRG